MAYDRCSLKGIQKVILLGGIPFGDCKSLEALNPDYVSIAKCVIVGKRGKTFVEDAHKRGLGSWYTL